MSDSVFQQSWESMASSMKEGSAGQQEQPAPRLQIYSTSDTVSPFWRGLSLILFDFIFLFQLCV